MSAPREPDTIIAAWLEEGPNELPEPSRRFIAVATRAARQNRRAIGAYRRITPMTTFPRLALAAAAIAIVAGGAIYVLSTGRQAVAGPSPTAAISSPASSPVAAATCTPKAVRFDSNNVDLTGVWAGDDGGIYYVRQLKSVVWWNGMSSRAGLPEGLGRIWSNVARGEIKPDLTLTVDWADVPRGVSPGHGTLALRIEEDGAGNVELVRTSSAGSLFDNTVWTPCTPG